MASLSDDPTDPVVPPELSAMDTFLAPFIKTSGRNQSVKRRAGKRSPSSSGPGSVRHGSGSPRVVLSIFDVPPALLTKAGVEQSPGFSPDGAASARSVQPDGARGAPSDSSNGRGLTCIRCGLSFDSRPLQLSHFKSTLHMANLRRQLAGKSPLSQQEHLELVASASKAVDGSIIDDGDNGGGVENASADEGDSSDTERDHAGVSTRTVDLDDVAEDAEEAEGVRLLTAQTAQQSGDGNGSGRGRVKVTFSLQEGPRLTFVPPNSSWCFSLSSAALAMERGDDPWQRLDGLVEGEAEGAGGANNRLWAVMILRSGKFAAAVFEGQSVVCHKVFRRYTIRAKRGGSQSSYDSGGRKAQSAGATLRRYGEQALKEDTRALLKEWEGTLKACRVVLTSVPKGMRAVLFDGKDAPFDRKDPRLRSIPFAVGKPVFEEVIAIHTRVTSIVFSDVSTVDFGGETAAPEVVDDTDRSRGAQEENTAAAAANTKGAAGLAAVSQRHAVEVEPCPPSMDLIEACDNGDVDAAVEVLNRLELNDDADTAGDSAAADSGGRVAGSGTWTANDVIDRPDGLERLMTPLHVAAAGGHVSVLGALLERGANPLVEDVRGRVPYLLASNKETRDAFRRARASQPERWDWVAARVPEPLTEELEQRKKEKAKEKEKEKKRRAKLRKKVDKEKAEEQARQKKAKEEAEAEDRRARGLAAAGHCDACGRALIEKKAFSRFEFRYCSSDCANLHKRKLAADAAERRFSQI